MMPGMSTRRWLGVAPRVAQVTDYLFAGTWEASDLITLTIGTKTVTVTAGSTTISTVVDNIVSAWNLLSSTEYPEFAEITASRTSNTLRLTADTAGLPFNCTVATTETGGGGADAQTIDGTTSSTGTDSTACSSPNHWSIAANWSGAAVPVDNDDVVFSGSNVDCLYGLSQTSIDLTSLTADSTFTGKLGLPDYTTGTTPYYEYRTKYLMLGTATTVNIGEGTGAQSQRLKIHLGSNAATVNVFGTGSPETTGQPALWLCGSNASNALNITQGNVGLATEVGQTAQFPTIRVGSEDSPASDVYLVCGSGCTLGGTITQNGGYVEARTAVTTWTKYGGTSRLCGTATLGTLTQDGLANHLYESSGTLTTATIRGPQSVLDCSRDLRGRTITNSTLIGGGSILDPNKTVTRTNPSTMDTASVRASVFGNGQFTVQIA